MDVLALFESKGNEPYGERVTQTAHALQSAALAEAEGAAPALIAAALLHDVGHLIAKPSDGDDRHEDIGAGLLMKLFGPAVAEPVRLHVAAKRFLCATQAGYFATLSPASVESLALQGGPFTADEAAVFARHPHTEDALRLRRWDDLAKVPDAPTKPLAAYATLFTRLTKSGAG
jgi:phosphonate degradation associated HDIG domain protein